MFIGKTYYFYVRVMQIDGIENAGSGEVQANSYAEAVDRIYKYHCNMYGRVLSIYVQEMPQNTAIAAMPAPTGGNLYGYA